MNQPGRCVSAAVKPVSAHHHHLSLVPNSRYICRLELAASHAGVGRPRGETVRSRCKAAGLLSATVHNPRQVRTWRDNKRGGDLSQYSEV